ncbi:MAG: hypothetical protein LBP56_09840 [Odoribacteraceae bacterium]|jgi:hypothetical protein|nr:hypothetical protein [Odoribacteraceae bacterium]
MMEKYDYIEDVILTVDEGNVVKKSKPLALALIVLLVGVVALYFSVTVEKTGEGVLSSLLLVAGLLLLVTGLVLVIVKKGRYLYRPTGQGLKKYKVYIAPENSFKLQRVLQEKSYGELKALRQPNASNLSLEIFLSDDREYALLQSLEFIPYNDVPTTPVIVCRGEEVRALADAIR